MIIYKYRYVTLDIFTLLSLKLYLIMFVSRSRYKVSVTILDVLFLTGIGLLLSRHNLIFIDNRTKMVSNNRQMNRNERQRQLNMALCVFPKFSPLFDCQIYLINQTTPSMLIQDLIQLAKQTTQFTIDTECDYITHKPALIQIEFLNINSVVLLIETCHLPHHSSVLFWLI